MGEIICKLGMELKLLIHALRGDCEGNKCKVTTRNKTSHPPQHFQSGDFPEALLMVLTSHKFWFVLWSGNFDLKHFNMLDYIILLSLWTHTEMTLMHPKQSPLNPTYPSHNQCQTVQRSKEGFHLGCVITSQAFWMSDCPLFHLSSCPVRLQSGRKLKSLFVEGDYVDSIGNMFSKPH